MNFFKANASADMVGSLSISAWSSLSAAFNLSTSMGASNSWRFNVRFSHPSGILHSYQGGGLAGEECPLKAGHLDC